MAGRRCFDRRGMETLVGIDKEVTQSERRFFDSREKDGANSTAQRRFIAYGRIDRFFQQGAAAKRANRGTRAGHKISPALQGTSKTTAADRRDDREHGGAQPENASRTRFRACHRPRRLAWPRSVTAHDAHRYDAFEIDSRGRKAADVSLAEIAGGKREESFTSVTVRTWPSLDRACLTLNARESRSHGRADPAPIERGRTARRTSDNARTKHSRTFRHER